MAASDQELCRLDQILNYVEFMNYKVQNVDLYFSEIGSSSINCKETTENYTFLDVELAEPSGNRMIHRARLMNRNTFTIHDVQSGITYVSFGTIKCEGTRVYIESQLDMPVEAYEFKSGNSTITCKIVSIIGHKIFDVHI